MLLFYSRHDEKSSRARVYQANERALSPERYVCQETA